MASCPGKTKRNTNCGNMLYRCKKCGNVGCDRSGQGECTNQAFRGGKCQKCGTSGQKENFK